MFKTGTAESGASGKALSPIQSILQKLNNVNNKNSLKFSLKETAQGLYDAGAFSPSDLTEDSMLKYADAVEMLRNYGIYTPSESVKNAQADADNTGYSRYRDTVSDWNTDRNFAYQGMRDAYSDYSNERNFDYGKYSERVGKRKQRYKRY